MRKRMAVKITICVVAFLIFMYIAFFLKLRDENLDIAKEVFAGYSMLAIALLSPYYIKGRILNRRVRIAILVSLTLFGFITTVIVTGSVFMFLFDTGRMHPVP